MTSSDLPGDDIAVRVRNLCKVYRLYNHPRYRVLDMLGLLRGGAGKCYTEHVALDNISMDVRSGEKVGIIGRNGAGKSTFLKLVTQVIRPSRGEIEIKGNSQALLQIGSGFHPEFTGRENVRAYLAHLGVRSADVERSIAEVVDFAELEEYIDQPVKTYSTGMAMRLMFAAATVFAPKLLVIDEVLGVGDAYFANKSFERIRAMCSGKDTTLLLVTHDIYSAAKLCDRMIWIDRGRILIDDRPKTVVRLYEEAVREQEEARLRQRRLSLSSSNGSQTGAAQVQMTGHIAPANQSTMTRDVFVRKLTIFSGDVVFAEWNEGQESGLRFVVNEHESNWASEDVVKWGAACRCLQAHGSIFQKGVLALESQKPSPFQVGASIKGRIVADSEHPSQLEVVFFDREGNRYIALASLGEQKKAEWVEQEITFVRQDTRSVASKFSVFGTGALRVTEVCFLNKSDRETQVFHIGEPFKVKLRYSVLAQDFDECPMFILTFQREGLVTHRLWCDGLRVSRQDAEHGEVEVSVKSNTILAGDYVVTVSVYREKAWAHEMPKTYFAINPDVLDFHAKAYEITVMDDLSSSKCGLLRGGLFQMESDWVVGSQTFKSPLIVVDSKPMSGQS